MRPASSRALALPLGGALLGVAYCFAAMRYQVGSVVAPGPGLFPLLAGLTMTLASVMALIVEYRGPSVIAPRLGESFHRVPLLVTALVAYALALKPVGFLSASTALTALVLVVLGRRATWRVAAIAIALSAGCYLTFRLLGVPLPSGTLGLR